jgi:hypothetical protein
VIRLRISGIVDLASSDLDEFDLTEMPAQAANALLAQAGEAEHLLYVEIGELKCFVLVSQVGSPEGVDRAADRCETLGRSCN